MQKKIWREFQRGVNKLITFGVTEAKFNHKKAALFDMDSTLIAFHSKDILTKKSFIEYPNVPNKLEALRKDGYLIIVITNQNDLERGRITINQLKNKIESVSNMIGGESVFLISGYRDIFRKPSCGSFDYLRTIIDVPLTYANSFFCGDMIGLGSSTRSSDGNFARNCSIPLYHPKAFFKCDSLIPSVPSPYPILKFDPNVLKEEKSNLQQLLHSSNNKEIVLLVGPPASGKTTLCTSYFDDHVRVNQDTLKTIAKCRKVAEVALKSGKSVIVDNTNCKKETRQQWIKIAKNFSIPIRAITIDATKSLVLHLNTFRSFGFGTDSRRIPDVAINTYFSRYECPIKEEGFQCVVPVPFVPCQFACKEEEAYFYSITY